MKFGVCGGPAIARIAQRAGYDYFEWSVGDLLHPREDEAIFEESLQQVKALKFRCPVVNVFLPADLKLTGPEVNNKQVEKYVTTAVQRAEKARVEIIVFGSGAARRIPDGFDEHKAHQQIVDFCRMLGPLAREHGVTIVIEPLNTTETNVITSVQEGADLVHEVDDPNICLLVDGYHWAKGNDTSDAIYRNIPIIKHAHVATLDGRRPPSPGDNCAEFFRQLNRGGYEGRVSIEGRIDDPATELPIALEVMRRPNVFEV